ncbi:fungal-specific transcription factor domain-containing protein [Aspergillus venezuelensis]
MEHRAFSLPPQRRRRPVKKSFFGCARCKARKVKCDETKPNCVKCSEKGFTCPGVSQKPKIRWSTKHERYPNDNEPLPTEGVISPSRLSSDKPLPLSSAGESSLGATNVSVAELGTVPALPNDLGLCDHDILELFESNTPAPDEQLISLSPFQQNSDENGDTEARRDRRSPVPTIKSLERILSQSLLPGLQLFDLESELVGAYFTVVCPIFSTFDSEANLFRSFVSDKWQYSISMFYALLSMAAAKLKRRKPDMKYQALEYQSLALSSLYADASGASGWTTELLFVVLMLGLSTCWHDVTDLGAVHLQAMQRAMADKAVQLQLSSEPHILEFFQTAVIYWEMVVCSVSDEVSLYGHGKLEFPRPRPDETGMNSALVIQPRMARIMPHPWAGVASGPQELFARVAQHIRKVRPFHSGSTLAADTFVKTLDKLDEEIWSLNLPVLHEIVNTGDEDTPAIDHLLLAEAYMFATLYQLYYAFPRRAQQRAKRLREGFLTGTIGVIGNSWAEQQAKTWSAVLLHDDTKQWVEFLGRNVIMRLEQIHITSGTSCVHSLLLLVAAGSLAVTPENEENGEALEILRMRQFVLDRLSQLSDLMLSEPVSQVKLAVLEVFKLLNYGVDVFWMDVLHSIGAVTVIG